MYTALHPHSLLAPHSTRDTEDLTCVPCSDEQQQQQQSAVHDQAHQHAPPAKQCKMQHKMSDNDNAASSSGHNHWTTMHTCSSSCCMQQPATATIADDDSSSSSSSSNEDEADECRRAFPRSAATGIASRGVHAVTESSPDLAPSTRRTRRTDAILQLTTHAHTHMSTQLSATGPASRDLETRLQHARRPRGDG